MSINTLPVDLYKANLDFYQRIGKLLQQGNRQWLEQNQQLFSENFSKFDTEVEKLLQAKDWQALSALPSETFRKMWQQPVADTQSLAQAAVSNQAAFVAGLTEAFTEWQKDLSSAVSNIGDTGTFGRTWDDFLKQMSALPAAATEAVKKSAAAAKK